MNLIHSRYKPLSIFMVVMFVVASAATILYHRRLPPAGNDGQGYARMSESIARLEPVPHLEHWPPLYPLIGAPLIALGLRPEAALRVVSLLSLLVLLWATSRATSELGLSPASVLLIALGHATLLYGFSVLSEMLFTALFFASVWMFSKVSSWRSSVVALLLTVATIQTRHIGICLLVFMALSLADDYLITRAINKWKLGAFVGSATLTAMIAVAGASARGYFWDSSSFQSGYTAGALAADFGVGLISVWTGEVVRRMGATWLLSAVALGCFFLLVVQSIRSKDRIVRQVAYAVLAYSGTLVAVSARVALDQIGRRFLFPLVPFLVILFFVQIKGRPRYAALAALIVCAMAVIHIIHGSHF